MKIAIASGKGGTGKTTIAVNLALTIASLGQPVTLLDCDVEEPNCHLFLKPEIVGSHPVMIPQPVVQEERCNGCGVCADVCEYHALTVMGGQVLVFRELCHGCGACFLLCPEKAIVEEGHPIGSVEEGVSHGIRFVQGRLNVGEVMSPAVIRQVRTQDETTGVCIIDSPPGTSCPVVESVRGTDFVLLVTEPTPFGLHDLTLAVEMVRALARPFAVALNRCDAGDEGVRSYCEREGIEILLSIPDDRRVAESYARGDIVIEKLPEYREVFDQCYRRIAALVKEGNARPGGSEEHIMSDNNNLDKRYLESCRKEFWQKVFQLEIEYLVERLEGCRDVLSVGCGPAIIESELSKRGFNVTGLDVSQEALNCAPDNVRTVVARAEDMTFPVCSFDAVIYVASLQFIDDYQKALEKSVSVLRPSGKIVVMLLNPASSFFKERFRDPSSYVSKIKHADLKAMEDLIAHSFTVCTEYFLSMEGERLLARANTTDAALYIILGTKRALL